MTSNLTPGFDTLCIHGGHTGEQHRAHLTPIYASSTYTFDSAEQGIAIFKGEEEGYIYGRFGNPHHPRSRRENRPPRRPRISRQKQ